MQSPDPPHSASTSLARGLSSQVQPKHILASKEHRHNLAAFLPEKTWDRDFLSRALQHEKTLARARSHPNQGFIKDVSAEQGLAGPGALASRGRAQALRPQLNSAGGDGTPPHSTALPESWGSGRLPSASLGGTLPWQEVPVKPHHPQHAGSSWPVQCSPPACLPRARALVVLPAADPALPNWGPVATCRRV